jgi:predicted CXXCH cytochrome family protein
MKNNFNKHADYRHCLAQGAKFCSRKSSKLAIVLAGGLSLLLMLNVAMASLSSTKHNLGSTGIAVNKFSGTTEICVFCHTPHGANNSVAKPAPIWNRGFAASSAYTTYDSLGTTSFDATAAPTGSVSLACLSCHDGTQAMNVMINTPGSGTVTTLSGTWSGANQTGGQINGSFTRIGVDLTNDHPVSIQYGGGGVSDSTLTGATLDPYFAQAVNSNTPNKRVGSAIGQVGTRLLKNNTRVWWVETNGTAGQQKDDLPLYSRTDLGTNQPFVECASCHDPHSNNTTFLRLPTGNESSGVCLTCHIK